MRARLSRNEFLLCRLEIFGGKQFPLLDPRDTSTVALHLPTLPEQRFACVLSDAHE